MSNPTLTIGTKYQAGRDIKDVAKDIRKDLKALGIKASVRISRYSLGQSIYMTIKEITSDEVKRQLAREAMALKDDCNPRPIESCYAYCGEKLVEAVANAYNRQEIDSMTDYYNVCFSASAEFQRR